jgi:hypothetical protein
VDEDLFVGIGLTKEDSGDWERPLSGILRLDMANPLAGIWGKFYGLSKFYSC